MTPLAPLLAMTDRFLYEPIKEHPDLPNYPSVLCSDSDSPKPAHYCADRIRAYSNINLNTDTRFSILDDDTGCM